MSEIVDDLKISNLEVTDGLGIRLSGTNPEIKSTQPLSSLNIISDSEVNITSTTLDVIITADSRIHLNSNVLVGNTISAIGFYGTTPTVLFESGVTGAVEPGTTGTVFQDTTFDGGMPGNNYTIDDIVNALKAMGLLAV